MGLLALGALALRQPSGEIALIPVSGVITTGTGSGGLFGEDGAGSEVIIDRLERARKDDDIQAVVLRIDSPGGSPAASEEIYREIKRVRSIKPVYASMGDVAASGGYYVASACNRIYADNSTITGSIGVIFESTNLSGLFKKLGVNVEVVKSGKYKDIGSPNRPMTPEEKKLIQSMINDTFDQFIDAVSEGRKMPRAKVKSLATGAVFTGRQAKGLGLIDDIGGLRETVVAAARAVGITEEPSIAKYGGGGGLLGITGENAGLRQATERQYDLIADRLFRRLTAPDNSLEGMR
jgi:protease-4